MSVHAVAFVDTPYPGGVRRTCPVCQRDLEDAVTIQDDYLFPGPSVDCIFEK
jgi:hypothetical protein